MNGATLTLHTSGLTRFMLRVRADFNCNEPGDTLLIMARLPTVRLWRNARVVLYDGEGTTAEAVFECAHGSFGYFHVDRSTWQDGPGDTP